MFKKVLKNQKGLTLIELLAVVVILGIIAAIAIPSIGNIIQKSKEDAVKSDAMQVISAAKTYVSANGIPEGTTPAGTMTDVVLKKYVDDVSLDAGYSVQVVTDTDGAATYKLTGVKTIGNAVITFTGATLKGIKADKDFTGKPRTITGDTVAATTTTK
ncbi:type IV pilin protein [Priestia koreensis]|uniref:type IV pilin protein n=1 Tax=Priestia koreensis TaxID=284581 RepID=UPI001F55BF42|nr:type II secretion system protein [Priestia koreensis]UNL84359.1 type II secretion system protein [Priestia koreensis]